MSYAFWQKPLPLSFLGHILFLGGTWSLMALFSLFPQASTEQIEFDLIEVTPAPELKEIKQVKPAEKIAIKQDIAQKAPPPEVSKPVKEVFGFSRI